MVSPLLIATFRRAPVLARALSYIGVRLEPIVRPVDGRTLTSDLGTYRLVEAVTTVHLGDLAVDERHLPVGFATCQIDAGSYGYVHVSTI